MAGPEEGSHLVGQPGGRGDPPHLGVLRGRVVAIGAKHQASGGRVAAQPGQPRPEPAEQLGFGGPGQRLPGAERVVPVPLAGLPRPGGEQGTPQVDAALGVLHVHVDLDVAARHPHPCDTPPPVGR